MESLARESGTFENGKSPKLIATLPQNSLEYAVKAQESGAGAVMVGIEKTELAFPGLFAGLETQEQSIREILSTLSIPVGVSIGEARPLSREGWESVVSLPFRFVNMYAHQMPLFVHQDGRIDTFVSIGPGYMLEQVKTIAEMEQVVALEAAIVSSQAKLYPFGLLDLSTITLISRL